MQFQIETQVSKSYCQSSERKLKKQGTDLLSVWTETFWVFPPTDGTQGIAVNLVHLPAFVEPPLSQRPRPCSQDYLCGFRADFKLLSCWLSLAWQGRPCFPEASVYSGWVLGYHALTLCLVFACCVAW